MPAGRFPDSYLYPSKTYGVFVGVNSFAKILEFDREYRGRLSDLQGCVNDATGLYDIFNKEDRFALLTEAEATRVSILKKFKEKIDQTRKGDLFIFQVSSHGVKLHNDCYFFPHDSSADNIIGTGIAATPIINEMSAKAKEGVKSILILDACDSGAVSFNIARYRGTNQGGISCIFGCSPNEKAVEKELNGKVHGLLAFAMIQALKAAEEAVVQENDEDEKTLLGSIRNRRYVTLRDMFDYAYEFVTRRADDQHPVLIGTLDGNTILRKF